MIFKATLKYSNSFFYLAFIIETLFQNLEIWSPIMTSTNAIKKSASSFSIRNLEFSNLHLPNLCMITHINMYYGIKFQSSLPLSRIKTTTYKGLWILGFMPLNFKAFELMFFIHTNWASDSISIPTLL
jgi:hypothetical protein